ncbi:MAG: hypothetical protein NC305_06245 [Lachnospiraceae bacterium]|nr:hypothetical protein [Butyrivibrio sp.]MCM1343365.1 hypothetical protein [Muribaculaceae bacterium]MCM1410131.1 hypothetical protein [Lachnospiraceae bacterium]
MIFVCKNCGGNVVYSPERHSMFCPYCDSVKSDERRDFPDSEITVCPNCGGEIPVEEHTSAAQCPYCDNYMIFNERVEGEYTPKKIIPFQMGKEACKNSLREKFKKCTFAPTDFLSEARLDRMQGYYVPFWFYSYGTNCRYDGEGTKVRSWTSGNTQYTETSYYRIHRNMDIDFQDIPVDASIQMPDEVMDLIAPFQYGQMEDFKPEYMSGFYGEKYNMTSDLVEFRARDHMKADAEKLLKGSISGYATVSPGQKDIRVEDSVAEYGLIPLWKYDYQYDGQMYPFYVNGQTGKIVGMPPISKKKVWGYTGTLWACLTAVMIMVRLIMSWFLEFL